MSANHPYRLRDGAGDTVRITPFAKYSLKISPRNVAASTRVSLSKMELFSGLLSSLGLSSAAGLNAYIPLVLVGLLQHFGLLHLQEPFTLLGNLWVLLIITAVGALDFVGDKIPGVDSAIHTFGGILNAAAGAVLFASNTHLIGHIDPNVLLLLGFITAGSVQLGRTVIRPAATLTTAGLGNPALSLAEDSTSATLSLLAIFMPIIAALMMIPLVYGGYRLWKNRTARARRL